MGVFDGWFGKRSDEPLAKLDPKVREFLERESPVKHSKSSLSSAAQQDAAAAEEAKVAAAAAAQEQKDGEATNRVPKESLYQDGRYTHLWKTYRPLSEIENETKSDEEKLLDVLEAYKARKAAIGTAALENCAEEQVEWSNCMRGGSVYARMTMCRDEVRKFERCYNMQSRLLKALGYLSAVDGSPDVEERIQLHADKLYHQMVEQEKAIDAAKKEGRPVPKFELVIPKQVTADAPGEATAQLSEGAKKRAQGLLDKLEDENERSAEEAALEAETRAKAEMVAKIQNLWKEQDAERKARKDKGEATMWDKVATVFKASPSSDGENKT